MSAHLNFVSQIMSLLKVQLMTNIAPPFTRSVLMYALIQCIIFIREIRPAIKRPDVYCIFLFDCMLYAKSVAGYSLILFKCHNKNRTFREGSLV